GGSLLVIAAVAAAALGGVNAATEEKIAQRNAQTKQEAMQSVLPSASSFNEEVTVGAAIGEKAVLDSYSEGLDGSKTAGYAFSVTTSGFSSGLNLMIGIDKEGIVTGVKVVKHSETPGLGANAENVLSPQFPGKSGKLTVIKSGTAGASEINAITGATITSNAVTTAVNDVQTYFENNLKGGKGK
ncbi:MAG: RnfABCDGE type electron transport complex subunit G, partial [Firmicutes bacterium]|nr:RnfABCDGE type electron transport complex subunit G [Bacillota bacterium]